MKIKLTINGAEYTAHLEDNPAARALADRLPAAWTMKELNGNEKYVYLSESLPSAPKRPLRIEAGDLMLYGTDCLVLFYRTFRTVYSYTRLGRIANPAGLEKAVGKGSVNVAVTIAPADNP